MDNEMDVANTAIDNTDPIEQTYPESEENCLPGPFITDIQVYITYRKLGLEGWLVYHQNKTVVTNIVNCSSEPAAQSLALIKGKEWGLPVVIPQLKEE